MLEALVAHGPLPLFFVQTLLVVGLARLLGLLAKGINQPLVIAEVAAGICLGPSLLGWLFPEQAALLFPASSLPVLGLVSQLGLTFFMFLIGLELDVSLLKGLGRSSVAISQSGIAVPFLLGGLLAQLIHPTFSSPDVPFTSFALFMGAAMSITAFPVLARILSERQLLQTRVGALAITCAAVDDVTAWCLLAFVVSIVRSAGIMQAVWTTLLAVGYIAVMWTVIRPFLARLAARTSSRESLTQNAVAVTFILLLLSAMATELIGIHALFGAFLFGAIMPRQGGFSEALTEKLEDFVVVLLLPLFFAYSGLRTHVGLLNEPSDWLVCAGIIFLACVGKFGGSTLAARLTGIPWRESSAIGVLMNTRGLMELIVLNIGLDLGVISPKVFTMMVLMALFTTVITTPLLRWIYPPELQTKALLEAEEKRAPPPPSNFTLLMCVAYGGSGPSMVLLARALSGSGAQQARLYALRLVVPTDRTSFYLNTDAVQVQAAEGFKPLLDKAASLGLDVRPLSFVSATPANDICNVAEVKGADLVLLGWHRPVLSQTALGGTVYEVMQLARTDVAVLIDRGLERVQRVLVPYYKSPHDHAALRLAHQIHQSTGAHVVVLHLVEPENRGARMEATQRVVEIFEQPAAEGRAAVELKVLQHPDPLLSVLEEASVGYDLVIIGVGEEWGLPQRPFGVRPEQLIQECPTSLLVVRQYQPTDPEA